MSSSQKGFAVGFVLLGVVVLVAVGGVGYWVGASKTNPPQPRPSSTPTPSVINNPTSYPSVQTPQPSSSRTPRACTLEAKICPDKSTVGRTGPNCEFAPCPSSKPSNSPAVIVEASLYSGWNTYRNSDSAYSIKYPSEITLNTINAPNYVSLMKIDNTKDYPFMILIFVSENKNGLSRREFFAKEWMNSDLQEMLPFIQINEVKLGSTDALNIVLDLEKYGSSSTGISYYLIGKGNKIITLTTLDKGLTITNGNKSVRELVSEYSAIYQKVLNSIEI